jgi:hypothetical protein
MTRTLLATTWAVVLLVVAVPLQAQSLAKTAKKAEEESAKAKTKPGDGTKADRPQTKVYTNKDLADVPPSTATAVPTETAASKTTTTSASTTTTQGEESWRSRARALRRTLADDQTKLAAAKAHYDSLPETAKGATGAPVVEAWMKAREDISRLTATVENDKRAIADLEDEARRAGVPPGWLRDK